MDLGRHFEASPSASSGGGGEGLVDMDSVWMPGGPASASAASLPQPAYLMPQQHGQVMTEEQLETLRRQISVYATICQQLVEMHKATVSQQHTFNGLVLGHQAPPQDSSILGMHHKTTSRQRWTPSQNQLRILERLFKQGNGTPNRQRIKEITGELSQHGQISETNVYNWFQNRKARAKRKQRHASQKDAGESEVETDGDSPEEKRNKVVDHPENNITTDITSSNPFEDDNRYSVVMLNEKAWKVRPGRLNVRSNFGENAVLLDPRGHVVAMNEAGLTLHPLQPAGTYTVAGLEGGGGTSHSPTLLDPGKTFQQQQQQQATTLTSSSRGGLQTRNRIYH